MRNGAKRQARIPRREEHVSSPLLERPANLPVFQDQLLRESRPGESQFDIGGDAFGRDSMVRCPFSGNPGQELVPGPLGRQVLEKTAPNDPAPETAEGATVESDPHDRACFVKKARMVDRPLPGPTRLAWPGKRRIVPPRSALCRDR